MSWVRNIIILIKLLKKLKDSVFPNLTRLDNQIANLSDDVDKLWGAVSFLANENSQLKKEISEIKGFIKGMEKALSLQHQINQIFMSKFLEKSNGK